MATNEYIDHAIPFDTEHFERAGQPTDPSLNSSALANSAMRKQSSSHPCDPRAIPFWLTKSTGHVGTPELSIDNLTSGETIHQPFVVVTGSIDPPPLVSSFHEFGRFYISVSTPAFPEQTFPISPSGEFKTLVRLQTGAQDVTFSYSYDMAKDTESKDDSEAEVKMVYNISYFPLLHVPPLLLAIMVAEDSPLWMDAPPEKAASSSHRDLKGAIAKTRMWAYMAQAFIAEEMRKNGLGRRSFRLEEEWAVDTLSINDEQPIHRMVAKVHIVKTKEGYQTMREPLSALGIPGGMIRPAFHQPHHPAEQDSARLLRLFYEALDAYGGPFETFKSDSNGPTVFGIIMDSHYDAKEDVIRASGPYHGVGGPFEKVHASLYGSHTHFAWPRFIEEISTCLTDTTRITARSRVSDMNNDGATFWESCATAQGQALHTLGLALGLTEQPTGVMSKKGYLHWNRVFVSAEGYSARTQRPGFLSLSKEPSLHLHLANLLCLSRHVLFALPTEFSNAALTTTAPVAVESEATLIRISAPSGIALLDWNLRNRLPQTEDLRGQGITVMEIPLTDLRRRFGADRALSRGRLPRTLSLTVTAMDGEQKAVRDLWGFATNGMVEVPGVDWAIKQKSVGADRQMGENQPIWKWAVLLSKLDRNGRVSLAQRLEIRIGAWFDGVIVHYTDGSNEVCGCKLHPDGRPKQLGGNPRNLVIGVDGNDRVTRISLRTTRRRGVGQWGNGNGSSFHGMSACTVRVPAGVGDPQGEQILEPDAGQKIVGFYGRNLQDAGFCPPVEFGILTIPETASLPIVAYGMPSLHNTNGGLDGPAGGEDSDLEDDLDEGEAAA